MCKPPHLPRFPLASADMTSPSGEKCQMSAECHGKSASIPLNGELIGVPRILRHLPGAALAHPAGWVCQPPLFRVVSSCFPVHNRVRRYDTGMAHWFHPWMDSQPLFWIVQRSAPPHPCRGMLLGGRTHISPLAAPARHHPPTVQKAHQLTKVSHGAQLIICVGFLVAGSHCVANRYTPRVSLCVARCCGEPVPRSTCPDPAPRFARESVENSIFLPFPPAFQQPPGTRSWWISACF